MYLQKSDKSNYSGDYFSRRFKAACKKVGIDESVHFHTLRHSFASHLAQKGVSLYVIKELLGHSSVSTTEIYSHLNMESLREAVDKLNGDGLMQVKAEKQSSKLKIDKTVNVLSSFLLKEKKQKFKTMKKHLKFC